MRTLDKGIIDLFFARQCKHYSVQVKGVILPVSPELEPSRCLVKKKVHNFNVCRQSGADQFAG